MSVYSKAKRHIIIVILSMPLIMWGVPMVASYFGLNPFAFMFPLMGLWLIIGGLGTFVIRCPNCGKSLFMHGWISTPWPEKVCSKCNTNLS